VGRKSVGRGLGCFLLHRQTPFPMAVDPQRFDLASLRLFVAVAEESNLTKAAKREHLVLSAASKRISELEVVTGAALLERHARGVRLTDAGRSLLHYARHLIAILHRMGAELSEHATGLRGHVRLHAIASALSEFLPADLHAFMKANPQIKVHLEEQIGPSIVEAVQQGSADVGIIAEQTSSADLVVRPYRRDLLALVVPAHHPLARRKSIRLEDALDYPFVGPHADSSLHALLVRGAAEAGKSLNVRVQVRSFDGMARLIQADLGVGVLPVAAVQAELKTRAVRSVALDEAWAERQLNLCMRDLRGMSLAARKLVQRLESPAA
jgi:DNA-binding transcriptional LysR family regulator